jgi:mono/diheme cytochrome c family protein/glucose/arabinose dehydrogenase
MKLFKVGAAVFTLAVTSAAPRALQKPEPWAPGLQPVAADSPVLAPDAAMKTFRLPPGYRIELVASEPLIQDPILIDWDAAGRLWAVEMPGYMPNMRATGEYEPTGRIVVLEDTDGNGAMDRRTVFLDGLVLPRTLKVLASGVIVGAPPDLWLVKDTDGDLKADSRDVITTAYGNRQTGPEHAPNGMLWGLDNWLHTSQYDQIFRLQDGKVVGERTLSRGQWGLSMDDAGRIYRNTNEAALFVDLVPARYYARNPGQSRTRGLYESLQNDEVNAVWPIRPTPGVNRGYQTGVLRPDGRLAKFTAVSAPTVYRGDRLPAELRGNVFVVEPAGNLVSRLIVSDNGSTLEARKAYYGAEFLASTDERFRPVHLSSAPDGTLYVVDMYRGIIQHRIYVTEYLRDYFVTHKLEQPTGLGRIYRVVHESTKRDARPALATEAPARLVERLSHPNGWWRDTAQRLLVERGDRSVAPALRKLAESAPDARTRLHALWTLDGLNSLEPASVEGALKDASRDVRASALRLAERWIGAADHSLQAAVAARVQDQDWSVRHQLAATLGSFPDAKRAVPMAALLAAHGDNPVTMDAALSGLVGGERSVLAELLLATTTSPAREAALTMLAAAVVRRGDEAPIQEVFGWIAETSRPLWQRSALLAGAEVVLTNGPVPGTPTGRGGGRATAAAEPTTPAPCPTCPGARGGPGGARAFQDEPEAPASTAAAARASTPAPPAGGRGGGGRRGGGRFGGPPAQALTLTREPALVAMAANDTGDLGRRATAVLARIGYPRQPGASTPAPVAPAAQGAAPLTAEEQKWHTAGREVYSNLCVACHQSDGQGREGLAPSLVESPLANAPAGAVIRLVLHGKEGSVGLMPGLGAVLTDEQVSAALTFIRREWGHTASPISPAQVKEVRQETASRTRPWTEAELLKIPE